MVRVMRNVTQSDFACDEFRISKLQSLHLIRARRPLAVSFVPISHFSLFFDVDSEIQKPH